MVSVKASLLDTTRRGRPQHTRYHALVTRLLQQRFGHAVVLIAINAYLVSVLFGHGPLFWRVFPLSMTGLRMLFFFTLALPLFIYRKAVLTLDYAGDATPITAARRRYASLAFAQLLGAYALLAVPLMWSYTTNCSAESLLSLTYTPRAYDMRRLNERFIYSIWYAGSLAFSAAIRFAATDGGRLILPINAASARNSDLVTNSKAPLPTRIFALYPQVVVQSLTMALGTALVSPIAYLCVRTRLWTWSLFFLRIFIRLPKTDVLTPWPVSPGLFVRTVWVGTCIAYLQNIIIALLNIYLSQGPLVRGRLLSDESTDPTDTLLDGLQNTAKPLTRHMAFMELYHISAHAEARRRLIFSRIDSQSNAWAAVFSACTDVVKAVSTNLAEQAPSKVSGPEQQKLPAAAHATLAQIRPSTPTDTQALVPSPTPVTPRMSPRVQNVFTSATRQSSPLYEALDAKVGRSGGSLRRRAASTTTTPREHTGTALKLSDAISQVQALATSAGRLRSVVTASPELLAQKICPNPQLVLLAIYAFSNMMLEGIDEDEYGVVANDVRAALQLLVQLHQRLAVFHAAELLTISRACSSAIASLNDAYGPYFTELGISDVLAREIGKIGVE